MRLMSIHSCYPGITLAKTIYTSQGTVLVGSGVGLTQRMIDRLIQYGISMVYIEDKDTYDIIIEDIISEETRREAMSAIHSSFESFQKEPQKWRNSFPDRDLGKRFRNAVTSVIAELKANKAAMNLLGTACGVDHYVYAHSFNVALYTIALAIKMGLGEKELTEIGIGSMLHDVGKMAIPYEVLAKPGKLTAEEFEMMKKHTSIGFELLRGKDEIPLLAAHCAFQHHERCDGTGYPRQLKAKDIHPYAKMLAVCDVFDALTSNRVYRKAMLPHEAIEILYSGAGTQFSLEAVEEFKNTIAFYPLGLTVTLNTGEKGIVLDHNHGMPSRPIVRILTDEAGNALAVPYELDLAKKLNIVITDCDAAVMNATM